MAVYTPTWRVNRQKSDKNGNVEGNCTCIAYFDAMFAECGSDAFRYGHHWSAVLLVEGRQFTRWQVFATSVTRGRQLNINTNTTRHEMMRYI